VRVVVKGAPELVMPLCTKVLSLNGDEEILKVDERDRILKDKIID
jgi:hypothetical protein